MPQAPEATQPLYSTLAADPELEEIVDMFVDEMPDRVTALLAHLEASDWEALRRAAHQLKGAAGSYGFDPISPYAARVERAVREGGPEQEIRGAVEELVSLCTRACRGIPP